MRRWFTLAQWLDGLSDAIVRADAGLAVLDREARRDATGWLPVAHLGMTEVRVTIELIAEQQTFWGRVRALLRRLIGVEVVARYRLRRARDRGAIRFECVVARRSPGMGLTRECSRADGGPGDGDAAAR